MSGLLFNVLRLFVLFVYLMGMFVCAVAVLFATADKALVVQAAAFAAFGIVAVAIPLKVIDLVYAWERRIEDRKFKAWLKAGGVPGSRKDPRLRGWDSI